MPAASPRQLPSPVCVVCGDFGTADAVLNILLFLPLGLGLALAGARPVRAAMLMLAASVGIEAAQLLLVGRHASLGDVIMNSAGGALGFVMGNRFDALLRPSRRGASLMVMLWSALWLALQVVASYALRPAPTESAYYGQIARDLGGLLVSFPGSVSRPEVGGVRVPDWDVSPDPIRRALASTDGALVRAEVVARSCPHRRAGILRIADAEAREIVVLAQDRSDLVFRIRTAAEAMRFRHREYRLPSVFGPGRCVVSPDSIILEATYTPRVVTMRARQAGVATEQRTTPAAFESWRLFSPFGSPETGLGVALVNAAWICLLTLAAGYFWWWRRGTGLALGAVLVLGLFVVPSRFGVATASAADLIVSLAGVGIGAVMARTVQRASATRA